MDLVFLETVGVGQIELDVVAASDCTVVVLVPESGDEVQAMKAGLMEIGDLFVRHHAALGFDERATEAPELVSQARAVLRSEFQRATVPLTAVFLEAFQTDCLEVARKMRV